MNEASKFHIAHNDSVDVDKCNFSFNKANNNPDKFTSTQHEASLILNLSCWSLTPRKTLPPPFICRQYLAYSEMWIARVFFISVKILQKSLTGNNSNNNNKRLTKFSMHLWRERERERGGVCVCARVLSKHFVSNKKKKNMHFVHEETLKI